MVVSLISGVMDAEDKFHQTILSTEACFCTVTRMPPGIFIVLVPGSDSVTSCGNVGIRAGLEGLDGKSVITESADEGTSLGTGRLTIGQTGGGERACGSEADEGRVGSNR